jgi:uncharacterized protein HemX
MKSRIVAALVLALSIGAGAAVSGKTQSTNSSTTMGNANMTSTKKHRKHRKHRMHKSTKKAASGNANK